MGARRPHWRWIAFDTVGAVKAMLQGKAGIPRRQQVLKFGGVTLEDEQMLIDYSIFQNATVDLAPLCLKRGLTKSRFR